MQTGIPKHVAIIMDGNGRWGKQRGMTRSQGHYAGVQAMEKVIDASIDLKLEALTLYAFSSENWSRAKEEVNYLMRLPVRFFKQKLPGFMKRNIKIIVSGDMDALPDSTKKVLIHSIEKTRNNDGLIVNFAFNYGGRAEIIQAVKKTILEMKEKNLELDEDLFKGFLYTSDLPDPELIIRTGGEKRLSNFLLWQSSMSELYFSDLYFPDFTGEEFKEAVYEYRERKGAYDYSGLFKKAR